MKQKKQVIYFVRAGELIKVGLTSDYDGRIQSLRATNASPIMELGVIEGDGKLEKSIHRRFHHCRSHGEWFYATPELMAYIRNKALSYEDGMGKVQSAREDVYYAGLTMRQMILAGLLFAPKSESIYQKQVKLTVLGALKLLLDRYDSGELHDEDDVIREIITAEGKIPLLDFEHIEELFLAMSVGMIQLKYVPCECPPKKEDVQ